MYPYPLIVKPMEFGLVFASLALVALEAGQSRRSYFLWFFSSLLPRAEFCTVCDPVCFSNLKPSSVLFVWLIVFIFNTIQCGVCHRVAKKNVCESFLGNILWCIDREAFPIVPVITYHRSSSSLEPGSFSVFPVMFQLLSCPYNPICCVRDFPVCWIATAKRIQLVIGVLVFLIPAFGCWIVVAHLHQLYSSFESE